LGFSGGPADKEVILREMLSSERMLITNDALIALSGATGGEPGIIVIGGTGSIAFGRNAEGYTARAGGWGYVFGDEGGGFDLARQALRAALRMEEGWGPATMLRQMLLDITGAADANDLLHRFYTPEFPRPRIARLSRLVDDAAKLGDEVARELLNRAADDLTQLALAIRSQLFSADDAVIVAYVGGVFRSETLLKRFEQGNQHLRPPRYGPAAGALIEAYAAAGLHPTLSQVPDIEK
jgi:N-acetylglucosamine kinase-like BadF-type ATPase